MTRLTKSVFRRWLQATTTGWRWTWRHQLYLYEKLHSVTMGHTKRLMIFMPPRHAKSETVTIRYTAWRLEREPMLNIILGSYNQKLANRFSRRIRRIVEERTAMSNERRAVDEWETQKGGGVRAVGVGAGIAGYGAQLVIIDDPVRNRADAESPVLRDNAWEWFNDDIYTRLEPKAAIILIQTRWHEDDLSGRILRQMAGGGETWDVVNLPALAEAGDELGRSPGEALWPERFDARYLEKVRRQQGTYSFSALYQQRPMPLAGGLFKRAWFTRVVEQPPPGLRWARGYDLAISTKTTADYTASFRCAFDSRNDLYISDGFRGRLEYPDQRRYVIERMAAERDTIHGIEKALHGEALVQDIRREPRVRRFNLTGIRAERDKVTRCLRWQSLAESGKVVLVAGAWMRDFLDEVASFPNGTHDDQIDAVSLAVEMLQRNTGRFHRF